MQQEEWYVKIKMMYHLSVAEVDQVCGQNAGNFYQGKSTLKVLDMDALNCLHVMS